MGAALVCDVYDGNVAEAKHRRLAALTRAHVCCQVDDPGIKRALMDGFPGVLETPDQHGRKILILFASNWDQSR